MPPCAATSSFSASSPPSATNDSTAWQPRGRYSDSCPRWSGTGLAKALAPGLTGPALSWISATPYTPSRYAKPSHDWLDFLRDDIAHELAYRGLPPAEVSLVSGEWAAFRRYRPSAQFRHDRRQGSATKPSALLRLQFKTSVTGPIALGHLSHFGLGLFTPE